MLQVVSKTPSNRHMTQITDIGREVFLTWRTPLHLSCAHSGSASPMTRWFFQGKEATWVNQASLFGRSQLKIESVKKEDSGNYTCVIENTEVLDSISYSVKVQGDAINGFMNFLFKIWNIHEKGNNDCGGKMVIIVKIPSLM